MNNCLPIAELCSDLRPGWKWKAFLGENVFFLKPETRIPKLREKRFTVFKKKTFLAKSLKRTAG